MSLQDFVPQYPLRTMATMISAADPDAHFDSKLILVSSTGLADAAIFLVPMFDGAVTELPTPSELLGCEMLWLQVQGKTESTDTTCTLVCDLIDGASFVTFEAVAQVYTASKWLIGKAKEAGQFTAVKPGGSASASSGKEAAAKTSSPSALVPHVRAQDLDGRDWGDKCSDKKGLRTKLDAVQTLTRLFGPGRMNRYCSELVFNPERLKTTCRNLKSTGKHPGVTPGAADDEEHADYGLDKFAIVQHMAVMQKGFEGGQGRASRTPSSSSYPLPTTARSRSQTSGAPRRPP
jgi:hypothetical protein